MYLKSVLIFTMLPKIFLSCMIPKLIITTYKLGSYLSFLYNFYLATWLLLVGKSVYTECLTINVNQWSMKNICLQPIPSLDLIKNRIRIKGVHFSSLSHVPWFHSIAISTYLLSANVNLVLSSLAVSK